MFGFMKSPVNKVWKQNSAEPGTLGAPDSDSDAKQTNNIGRRTSSEPSLIIPDMNEGAKAGVKGGAKGGRNNDYKNDFQDSGGFENQSVQELENYAVHKAEETTSTVKNCLKIAEDIREDATKTLDMLHQQGEQITRTHNMAVDMDKDLSKGEKLLGNLGGMFSRTWKPKKGKEITGPLSTPDTTAKKSQNDVKQREKLGIAPVPKGKSNSKTPPPEPTNAIQKVELEKAKQDDDLSDLSNILGDLKSMAVDMGTEIERQNKDLDHLGDDIDELNSRVKGANQRARKLLGK